MRTLFQTILRKAHKLRSVSLLFTIFLSIFLFWSAPHASANFVFMGGDNFANQGQTKTYSFTIESQNVLLNSGGGTFTATNGAVISNFFVVPFPGCPAIAPGPPPTITLADPDVSCTGNFDVTFPNAGVSTVTLSGSFLLGAPLNPIESINVTVSAAPVNQLPMVTATGNENGGLTQRNNHSNAGPLLQTIDITITDADGTIDNVTGLGACGNPQTLVLAPTAPFDSAMETLTVNNTFNQDAFGVRTCNIGITDNDGGVTNLSVVFRADDNPAVISFSPASLPLTGGNVTVTVTDADDANQSKSVIINTVNPDISGHTFASPIILNGAGVFSVPLNIVNSGTNNATISYTVDGNSSSLQVGSGGSARRLLFEEFAGEDGIQVQPGEQAQQQMVEEDDCEEIKKLLDDDTLTADQRSDLDAKYNKKCSTSNNNNTSGTVTHGSASQVFVFGCPKTLKELIEMYKSRDPRFCKCLQENIDRLTEEIKSSKISLMWV